MRRLAYLGILCSVLIACNKEELDLGPVPQAQLVLVSPTGGFGDNGYNDLILQGVLRYGAEHNLEVSLNHVRSNDEARAVLARWRLSPGSQPSILLMADNAYSDIVLSECAGLPAGKSVLLFESSDTLDMAQVSTFSICRYGVSYLAGLLAGESAEAHVIKACPGNDQVDEAARGFADGYLSVNPSGRLHQRFLADSEKGYNMADSAYRVAYELDSCFVYPLAGGSNTGFYKYTSEHAPNYMLVSGMDTDCQMYSPRVPFSVVIHIDKAINRLLDMWQTQGLLEGRYDFGLDGGYADIVLSHCFYDSYDNVYEEYYSSESYWKDRYDNYRSTAEEAENTHCK